MYKNILFAVEFTEAASTAGKKVKKLAETFQASLFLIHAIELPILDVFPEIPNKEKLYIQEAKQRITGIGKNLDIPESHQYIEVGDARIVFPEFIEKYHIDLLVVGHHETRGIDRILGSTAYALLAHAKYEVLVMPYSSYK
jgi:universal stress protein A